MEKKNLRKTEGLPFTLGMAGGVFLLLSEILSYSLNPVISAATYSVLNVKAPAALSGGSTLVWTVVSFLVVPGIFLFLLIRGRKREKRGSAFAVVWIVISGISFASNLFSLFSKSELTSAITAAVDAVMPGGYGIIYGLNLIGSALMIASCVALLRRLHRPPVLAGPEDTLPQ